MTIIDFKKAGSHYFDMVEKAVAETRGDQRWFYDGGRIKIILSIPGDDPGISTLAVYDYQKHILFFIVPRINKEYQSLFIQNLPHLFEMKEAEYSLEVLQEAAEKNNILFENRTK